MFMTERVKEASNVPSNSVAVTALASHCPKRLSAADRFYLYWTPAENIDPVLVLPFQPPAGIEL